MRKSTIQESLGRIKGYLFYKYRLSWSSKITEWKTVRLPEGYDAKGFFDDMSHEHSWSEHFHGVEYKKCKPTEAWLEGQILSLRNQAHDITQLADDYCWILQGIENERKPSTRKVK